MNLKLILQILLIVAIISTLCICVVQPKMHKTVLVYDSGYTITPEESVQEETYVVQEIPEQPQAETVKMTVNDKIDSQIEQEKFQSEQYTINKNVEPVSVTSSEKIASSKNNVTTKQNVSAQTKQKTLEKPTATTSYADKLIQQTNKSAPQAQTSTTKNVSAPIGNSQKNVQTAPVGSNTVAVRPQTRIPQPITSAPQPKILTPQEEEIAWNKWRSNLQNQIMRDSRLPNVPNGTIFKFSFTVDKYGKVTNVKTYSANPAYTPYAIQYIAPVIRGYQGHSILTFPAGSSRNITDVTGSWKVTSGSAKYSTPQDYNDIEKVRIQ